MRNGVGPKLLNSFVEFMRGGTVVDAALIVEAGGEPLIESKTINGRTGVPTSKDDPADGQDE